MVHEEIQIHGHVLDSLTLPKILDAILAGGGTYEIEELRVGTTRKDPSNARLVVRAARRDKLERILETIALFGAKRASVSDATLAPAPRDGILPDDFTVTTNLPTEVRVGGAWISLEREEMDCAIVVEREGAVARPVRMASVKKGDLVVCGREGVQVTPLDRSEVGAEAEPFAFMAMEVSAERPTRNAIEELSRAMRAVKRTRGKILFVVGPAVVHAGASRELAALIRGGWVNVLFAGNALAAHDIEHDLFGTSLGMRLADGRPAPHGHENHLRAINRIRQAGSIAAAVKKRIVRRGIMHALVAKKVPFVLAGSLRDDGPLPDVISDVVAAQAAMRAHLRGVKLAVFIATVLHGIATGNMLSAEVRTVCVDVNAEAVTKLRDRGSAQATGLVMDCASFLRELARALRARG